MNKNLYILFFILISFKLNAQNDTLKIGQLLISKPADKTNKSWNELISQGAFKGIKVIKKQTEENKEERIQTNWFAFDIGFVNYLDETKYDKNKTLYDPVIGLPMSKLKMQLNNAKSTNINLWIFQQKFKFKQPGTYLKYSIGMEMFNFRYENPINYRKNELMSIFLGDSSYDKNKLLTTYISAPIQFGYDYKLKNKKTIGISGGVIIGYLYKSINKQINSSLGKEKYKSDFSLNDMRLAGIFEIKVDKLKFFGTASLQNMLDKMPTNQSLYPYSFGLRFSKF
ncbi:MAG: hypothetical protein EBS55_04390 [Flavobacteriaceae bacterium]|nr:hypothetical protein [Flavobacteriaceae bacterium]